MLSLISTFAARIVAAWIAGLAGWLFARYGVNVDTATQQQLVQNIVGIILPIVLTVYSIAHRLISKKSNPGDAASSHLAEKESAETQRLKD